MGKKKGAGNKLARMSEEERARYLQHRAEIEEEARRRKQQLIAIFMKNKLKREEAFSRLNLAKINQEWRTILRSIKCQELKDEIKVVEEYFCDALTRKNQVIQRLLYDLDENEEMYATMSHSHIRNIDSLIGLHNDRVSFWRSGYLKEKSTLMMDFHQEMSRYKERKLGAYRELECVYYGLDARAEKEEEEAANQQMQKLDNVKSEMILQLQSITDEREQTMDRLWTAFRAVLNEYLRHTEEFHTEYLELRRRDDEDTRIISFHYAEVLRCTEAIADLKHDMDTHRDDHAVRMEELHRYKRLLQQKLADRKTVLNDCQGGDKERMRSMVVCSNETISWLKNLLKKGESIIQIGAMCEKYETDREVLPTPASVSTEDASSPSVMPKVDIQDGQDVSTKDIITVLSDMDHFWKRYNNAEVDCACLSEEKAALKKENRRLKEQLKMYLTNVTLNDGSGGNVKEKLRPSSMRIERFGRADEFSPVPQTSAGKQRQPRRRPVTCVEGNLTPAVRSQSLVANRVRMPDVYAFINY